MAVGVAGSNTTGFANMNVTTGKALSFCHIVSCCGCMKSVSISFPGTCVDVEMYLNQPVCAMVWKVVCAVCDPRSGRVTPKIKRTAEHWNVFQSIFSTTDMDIISISYAAKDTIIHISTVMSMMTETLRLSWVNWSSANYDVQEFCYTVPVRTHKPHHMMPKASTIEVEDVTDSNGSGEDWNVVQSVPRIAYNGQHQTRRMIMY